MKHFLTFLPHSKKRFFLLYFTAGALLLLSILLGLSLGSTRLSFSSLLTALKDGAYQAPEVRIFLYVRLPRLLASLLAGGALALSGAVLQGALGNRLASPSVIGVNAGAGFAVTLASALGILGGLPLSLFAFGGALLSVMLVSLGAKKWGLSRGTVILLGVALNSLLGAARDAVTVFVPDTAILGASFRVGDFSGVSYARILPAAVLIPLASLILFTLSNELDLLTLGDENAYGLGLHAARTRALLLVLSAVLAGAAVSLAGLLSFVGLLVPHAVRRFSGASHKHLLSLTFLYGGGFVSLCDTLSRVILAPYEIPVGIPMALIGAPFFLVILIKKKGGHRRA